MNHDSHRMRKLAFILVFVVAAAVFAADPIGESLKGRLKPSAQVFLEHHRANRRYKNADFPKARSDFERFKADVVGEFTLGLGLKQWSVHKPNGKLSPIGKLFEDRVLERREIHGVPVEVHAVTLEPTGLVVPMVLCLPPGDAKNLPGVCVFSGHTSHGLRDLVLDLGSYQQGVAIRLAKAGMASLAVEKIDTGYLSRNGAKGNDEKEIATLLLGRELVLRSHQLRACLAATEILAAHPRVDEKRIGATGVSLGGWLSVQTAMLNDRIRAVADFGRKTRTISENMTATAYRGQGDLCHIIPGMLSVCERNILPLALAPIPMLAGHGVKDTGSHKAHAANYRELCEKQYETLGRPDDYRYLVHSGGDTMPSKEVVGWFRAQFGLE